MEQSILTSAQLTLLDQIGLSGVAEGFYLAGGTALSLYLAHRASDDFDFFFTEAFDVEKLHRKISSHFENTLTLGDPGTLILEISGIKVTFFHYPYSPLKPAVKLRSNVAFASLEDIAAMKLSTIALRGARRDFVDLYVLCNEKFSLPEVLDFYDKRFGVSKADRYHLLRSLVYFEDAERDPMPKMSRKITWDESKAFFVKEVKNLL